jgi:putative nucleotidyltransferase with HDIG domain
MSSAPGKALSPVELHWDPKLIPVFPTIALKAMKLLGGRDTSLLELCNLIRADLAFSASVLRIANSPLIAFSRDVTNVLQASMLLGFRRLRSMVIAVALKEYVKDSFTPLMRSCWQHSVATAILAERTALWTLLDADFAYAAGLLHDIGRMALITTMPAAYARVIESGARKAADILISEIKFCGINHCEAGQSLMTAWKLPSRLIELAAHNHDSGKQLLDAASLIPSSCGLADFLGYAVFPCQSVTTYQEIVAQFPDAAQNHFPAIAEKLATDLAKEIKALEMA